MHFTCLGVLFDIYSCQALGSGNAGDISTCRCYSLYVKPFQSLVNLQNQICSVQKLQKIVSLQLNREIVKKGKISLSGWTEEILPILISFSRRLMKMTRQKSFHVPANISKFSSANFHWTYLEGTTFSKSWRGFRKILH